LDTFLEHISERALNLRHCLLP